MAEAVKIKRYPFAPGVVSQRRYRVGDTAGRFDETRAQEAPTVVLPIRSSIAGRKMVHHFAWIKHFGTLRVDGIPYAIDYPYSRTPKIINSAPTVDRTNPRPTMSRYPKPSSQGGMRANPRFSKASPIKQNVYLPPIYGSKR